MAGRRRPEDDAVRNAFVRGDFCRVRELAPDFVAARPDAKRARAGLFARDDRLRAISVVTAIVLALAWAYALTRRGDARPRAEGPPSGQEGPAGPSGRWTEPSPR